MKAHFEHVSYKFGLAGGNCSQSDQTENYSSCYLVAGEQEQEQEQQRSRSRSNSRKGRRKRGRREEGGGRREACIAAFDAWIASVVE